MSSQLHAGAGRAVITPPVGFPMGGWSNALQDRSQGNDMDLTATVLLVTDGAHDRRPRGVDLCLITDAQAAAMRAAIGEAVRIPVEAVRVTATHNHSAPVTGELTGAGWMFEGLDAIDPYMTMVAENLGRGGTDSVGEPRAGDDRLRDGTSPLAVNRRADMPGGGVRVAHNWNGPGSERSRRPARRRLRRPGRDDRPLLRSPDDPRRRQSLHHPGLPRPARRTVERSLGGLCLFLQGTPGDIGTVETFVDELEPYRRLGTMLGHDAAAVAAARPASRAAAARRGARPVVVARSLRVRAAAAVRPDPPLRSPDRRHAGSLRPRRPDRAPQRGDGASGRAPSSHRAGSGRARDPVSSVSRRRVCA